MANPQFRPVLEDVDSLPEAKELAEIRANQSNFSKRFERIADSGGAIWLSMGSALLSITVTPFGFLYETSMLVFNLFWAPVAVFATTVALIASPSLLFRKRRSRDAVLASTIRQAEKRIEADRRESFGDWIQEHYGLRLSPHSDVSWSGRYKSQPIELLTDDGTLLDARAIRNEDGSYELRKRRVNSPAESTSFETVDQRSALTAQRETPAISAERS